MITANDFLQLFIGKIINDAKVTSSILRIHVDDQWLSIKYTKIDFNKLIVLDMKGKVIDKIVCDHDKCVIKIYVKGSWVKLKYKDLLVSYK